MSEARIQRTTGRDRQAATVAAVTPALATERKLLPEGNVAIVRRYTDNAHRIYFSVEIGQMSYFPYPKGTTQEEAAIRAGTLEVAYKALLRGEITDQFVIGRKEGSPTLVGIKPIDPEKRVLTVEAPKDRVTGKLGTVTLRVPGNKPVKLDTSFLELLGDVKKGTIFPWVTAQLFYDVQQGQFPAPEPTTLPSKPVV